jgi:acetyl-CoA C-acetyltransferase
VSIRGKAFVAGAYEHPLREIPDRSSSQIQAECAVGALRDAGLTFADVDGYFTDAVHGSASMSMPEYMGLKLTHVDSTDTAGSSAVVHVGHAAEAIAAGKCSVALITMAGRPRSTTLDRIGTGEPVPDAVFEGLWGMGAPVIGYALAAARHMYEFGTTSAQLAEVKVAASIHASHNQNAFLRAPVTVDEVLDSPLISSPLRRLDCCVVTDGGGALVVVRPEIAGSLGRSCVQILGHGEAVKHTNGGRVDVTYTGGVVSGATAFEEAGVGPADIDYASLYDSFTITVIETLEDLGFCARGMGGRFVLDGALVAPHGRLPFNTDGGGLCNNHPGFRGGMIRVIEAVRQLRDEAAPALQVPDCQLAVAHGNGGLISTRVGNATLIMGREDA